MTDRRSWEVLKQLGISGDALDRAMGGFENLTRRVLTVSNELVKDEEARFSAKNATRRKYSKN
jgi:hypothetical protein